MDPRATDSRSRRDATPCWLVVPSDFVQQTSKTTRPHTKKTPDSSPTQPSAANRPAASWQRVGKPREPRAQWMPRHLVAGPSFDFVQQRQLIINKSVDVVVFNTTVRRLSQVHTARRSRVVKMDSGPRHSVSQTAAASAVAVRRRRPSADFVRRPRRTCVAFFRIAAVSRISRTNVDWPARGSSADPTRAKTRSNSGTSAESAGTYDPT